MNEIKKLNTVNGIIKLLLHKMAQLMTISVIQKTKQNYKPINLKKKKS